MGKLTQTKYSNKRRELSLLLLKKGVLRLTVVLLIITHIVVGAFGYIHGTVKTKTEIEQELLKVLDEYQKKNLK